MGVSGLREKDDNLGEADLGPRQSSGQPDPGTINGLPAGIASKGPATLPLKDLHERHPGLTEAIAKNYAEAAAVCLDRHHKPPVVFDIQDQVRNQEVNVAWKITDSRTRGAWANSTDATEAGAYACAIAATELARGLVAICRAETLTGADYYVGLPGQNQDDLEKCLRLEISGTDSMVQADVKSRLRVKLKQAAAGRSNLPALAAVVGFRCRVISLSDLDLESE